MAFWTGRIAFLRAETPMDAWSRLFGAIVFVPMAITFAAAFADPDAFGGFLYTTAGAVLGFEFLNIHSAPALEGLGHKFRGLGYGRRLLMVVLAYGVVAAVITASTNNVMLLIVFAATFAARVVGTRPEQDRQMGCASTEARRPAT